MDFVINLQPLVVFFSQPLYVVAWKIFIYGGWVPTLILFGAAWFVYRRHSKQLEFFKNTAQVCLAVDVPRENVQSLRAAEQMFAALWGILGAGTKWEQNWEGKIQLGYSFELVSLEGSIQYLVRTPVKYRSIVEAAIYGQYPDAEIAEVQDYMATVPQDAWKLDSPYKVWGTQAKFGKHNAYPIRTYTSFENDMVPDERLVDPLAPLLEAMSRLGPGEMLAIQYVIRPLSDEWTHSANKVLKKLIGEKPPVKEHLGDKFVASSMKGFGALGNVVLPSAEGKPADKKDKGNKLGQMTPGGMDAVKAIEHKMSKTCFEARIRHVYIARKEAYDKVRGVPAFWGAMRALAAPNLNALRPNGKISTEVHYWRVNSRITDRRRKILNAYRERSYFKGSGWLVLSTEELATLWHFPLVTVKTPMLRRAGARKGEAPAGLVSVTPSAGTMLGAAPAPELTAEAQLDLDDKTFEQQLALGRAPAPLGSVSPADAAGGEPVPPTDIGRTDVETQYFASPSPDDQSGLDRGAPPPNLPIA